MEKIVLAWVVRNRSHAVFRLSTSRRVYQLYSNILLYAPRRADRPAHLGGELMLINSIRADADKQHLTNGNGGGLMLFFVGLWAYLDVY
jgi:hypothetical protein